MRQTQRQVNHDQLHNLRLSFLSLTLEVNYVKLLATLLGKKINEDIRKVPTFLDLLNEKTEDAFGVQCKSDRRLTQ